MIWPSAYAVAAVVTFVELRYGRGRLVGLVFSLFGRVRCRGLAKKRLAGSLPYRLQAESMLTAMAGR
jgi:hypothetical protein